MNDQTPWWLDLLDRIGPSLVVLVILLVYGKIVGYW